MHHQRKHYRDVTTLDKKEEESWSDDEPYQGIKNPFEGVVMHPPMTYEARTQNTITTSGRLIIKNSPNRFDGNVNLNPYKALLPREITPKVIRNFPYNIPYIPHHIRHTFREEFLCDLWQYFLDHGADNSAVIYRRDLPHVLDMMLEQYPDCPLATIPQQISSNDDFVSYQTVIRIASNNANVVLPHDNN